MAFARQSILTLNDDVLFGICQALTCPGDKILIRSGKDGTRQSDLKQFAATCKRIRNIAAPELFRDVRVGRWYCGWADVSNALESINQCAPAARYVRTFAIEQTIGYTATNRSQFEPSPDLARDLAHVLQKLQRLEVLTFEPFGSHDTFRKAFGSLDVRLASVKVLLVKPGHAWLPAICESLQTLISTEGDWGGRDIENLIEASSGLRHVRRVRLKAPWNVEELRMVQCAFPDLQLLDMANSRARYATKFSSLVPVLAKFKDLRILCLANTHCLDAGFNPPLCGNAYQGPRGQTLREHMQSVRIETNTYIARAAFTACPALEDIWIGKCTRITVTRDSNGRLQNVSTTIDDKPELL